jgi:selenide,water dikinase
MCEGSGFAAVVEYDRVPVIAGLEGYLAQKCFPGGTQRNWASYGHKIGPLTDEQRYILADPQTSGGLLVAVAEDSTGIFEAAMREQGHHLNAIGWLTPQNGLPLITVV